MTEKVWLKTAAVVTGATVGAMVYCLPIVGLPFEGRKCLALSLAAVIWWASAAIHPGFTAAALLAGYALLLDNAVTPSSLVFGVWTTPAMYLVIGGFLIAHAVQECGLGRRLSLLFVNKFVSSYRSVIVSCYVLGFLLSFIIPHPWPRSLLLMSVMHHVILEARITRRYSGNVGLAVFAGSIPSSSILLTGDSTLNPLVGSMAGVDVSYFEWLRVMGVPGIVATVATCLLQLALFRGPKEFFLNPKEIARQVRDLGRFSEKEKWVAGVLAVAIALWTTDALTGINPAWVAVFCVAMFAMPFVEVLDAKSWRHVNMGTLLFLCAALAVGAVGGSTGMNAWLARTVLPAGGFSGVFGFVLVAIAVCMLLHVFLGSTLAVIGIAGPAIIAFGVANGVPPLVSAMVVYCAIALHWLLPFHHMGILVGMGEDGGGYTNAQVLRFGLFQTLVAGGTCLFGVAWWKFVGLL